MWIYHIVFIHLSVDRHLGCFLFLTIMNNNAINIHAHIFVWTFVFTYLWYILGMEFLCHVLTLHLTFLETAKLFSKVCIILDSHQQPMIAPVGPHPCLYWV